MCVLKPICIYYQRFQVITSNLNYGQPFYFGAIPNIESTTVLSDYYTMTLILIIIIFIIIRMYLLTNVITMLMIPMLQAFSVGS